MSTSAGPDPALFLTQDGSHSLFAANYGVSYHSRYGALTESQHVFIDMGLLHHRDQGKANCRILEIGWGTGLNALLTYAAAERHQFPVDYLGVEGFPIDPELAAQFNYPDLLPGDGDWRQFFTAIHQQPWFGQHQYGSYFSLEKMASTFDQLEFQPRFDLIYFDAFAPSAQPAMWEAPILEKMLAALVPGGFLVTYCAKGSVKRTLREIGFVVESPQGPPGKREMTRAYKR